MFGHCIGARAPVQIHIFRQCDPREQWLTDSHLSPFITIAIDFRYLSDSVGGVGGDFGVGLDE